MRRVAIVAMHNGYIAQEYLQEAVSEEYVTCIGAVR